MAKRKAPGGVFRRWRTVLTDTSVAVAFFLFDIAYTGVRDADGALRLPYEGAEFVLPVGAACALLFRRFTPGLVTIFCAAIDVTTLVGGIASDPAAIAIGLYSAALYRSRHQACLLLVGTTAIVTLTMITTFRTWDGTLLVLTTLIAAYALGRSAAREKNRRQLMFEAVELRAQAAHRRAELIATEERQRIAGEMHDAVSHGLTVMVRLADGAEAIQAGSSATRDALRAIGGTGREAMQEMRTALGRIGENDRPDSARIGSLIERGRLAGLPIEFRPPGRPIPDTIHNLVYRTIQEAITNVLRYADRPSVVLIEISVTAETLLVTVTDDGRQTIPRPSSGSSSGIVSLRTRAAALGGSLVAGPVAGARPSGWRVALHIPQPHTDREVTPAVCMSTEHERKHRPAPHGREEPFPGQNHGLDD